MKKVACLFLATITLCLVSVSAKTAVGEWRTHFSYKTTNQVVFADDKLYVEANGKLFSLDLDDGNLFTYTTLDGLSGHTVSYLGWCSTVKTLIVVYSDGNIDFLTKNGIVNLPDFKNKSLTADKTIYGLRVLGNEAYLSTGVGLLVVDMAKKEFAENYYLGFTSSYTKCMDAVVWGDSLMVATSLGLYTGKQTDNLQDVDYWKSVPFVSGTTVKKMVRFGDRFFALGSNGVLYAGQPGNWLSFLNDGGITELTVQDNALFACSGTTTYLYDSSLQRKNVGSVLDKSVAWDSSEDKLYMASGVQGLSILTFRDASYVLEKDSVVPDGPPQNTAWNAFFRDGIYYATAGARWGDRYFYEGDLLIFENEEWRGLTDKQNLETNIGFKPLDFINMAMDPSDKAHYFITTWGDGLLEFRNDRFYKRHDPSNSPLKNIIPGRYCRVDGAVFDHEGNLWVLNSKYYPQGPADTRNLPDSALLILKPDGTWIQPFYADLITAPTWNTILFTSEGQTWMNAVRERPGIFVLDDNGTVGDSIDDQTSDDQTKAFDNFTDQDGNILSPWAICCMVEDKNGTIWLGTTMGPILANGVSNVFKSGYTFTRVKIPRNDGTDNADYLLNDIRINCMAIDGANRKWIGTEGYGVYLLSSDGQEAIHHFDTDNSPLPSDYIWSLSINPETGEVFIGSDAGIVSYRSDATEGASYYNDIYVFPNPVRPEHVGVITVTGLMENTQVRITDLNGNAIVNGTSLGGQFCWNGYTKSGKKAASGVYLIFCASEDGTEYQACKFMIVR
jgi:hypothetical protein